MMKHDDIIEYLAALTSFLLPIWIAVDIYVLVKKRDYQYFSLIKLGLYVLILTGAYCFLTGPQRAVSIALSASLALIIFTTNAVSKYIKGK